jgi:hypothetical protein
MDVSVLSGWFALEQLGWCVGFSMNLESSFLSSSRFVPRHSETISTHTSSSFPPSILLTPVAVRASSTRNVALSIQTNPDLGPKNPGLGLCVIKHRLNWLSMSFSLSSSLSLFLTLWVEKHKHWFEIPFGFRFWESTFSQFCTSTQYMCDCFCMEGERLLGYLSTMFDTSFDYVSNVFRLWEKT